MLDIRQRVFSPSTSRRRHRLLSTSLALTVIAALLQSALATAEDLTLETIGDLPSLDLGAHRESKQAFKNAAIKNEDGVAVGLIDALQRWADALEAQISLMRNEVISMKATNRKGRDELVAVKKENVALRKDVTLLRAEMDAMREESASNQGEMKRETAEVDARVDGMKEDLQVFSGSFSEFLEHYDRNLKETRRNNTITNNGMAKLRAEMLAAADTNRLKTSLDNLANTVSLLSQADYILEERLKTVENKSRTFEKTMRTDLVKMKTTIISPTFFNEVVTNLTSTMTDLRAATDMNMTTLAFSVKAIEQNLKLVLHNTSLDLTNDFNDIKDFVRQVQTDLRLQTEAFAADFGSIRKSIDFAKDRYDELRNVTDVMGVKLAQSTEVRNNFTTAVLLAINELGERIEDSEAGMKELKPEVDRLNTSLTTFLGQVGTEILKLHLIDEDLRANVTTLNASMTASKETVYATGNATFSLSEQLFELEQKFDEMDGMSSILRLKTEAAERNYTLVVKGIGSLEKHFIDMKQDVFAAQMNIADLNASVADLGIITESLGVMQNDLEANGNLIREKVETMGSESFQMQTEVLSLRNTTTTLTTKLQEFVQNITMTQGKLAKSMDVNKQTDVRQNKAIERVGNKTAVLEMGLTGLMNYSVEIQANISRLLVFAAENKAEILELKVAGNGLEAQIGQLNDLHDLHTDNMMTASALTESNLTRVAGMAEALETELDTMTQRYQTLESLFTNYAQSTGEMEVEMERLQEESVNTRSTIEDIKFELSRVEAGTTGMDVFISSIQNHISTLTANVTSVAGNLTATRSEMRRFEGRVEVMGTMMNDLTVNVTENRDGLVLVNESVGTLRSNSSTLKANILGLGNYINNVNGDLSKLATTFENYISDLTNRVNRMGENVTQIEVAGNAANADILQTIQGMENVNANLKGEIATLTTKTYTMKTTLFEQQNEISTMRADQNNLVSEMNQLEEKIAETETTMTERGKDLTNLRSDLGTLRTGLTSLTNSMFNIKASIVEQNVLESRLGLINANITEIAAGVSSCRRDVSSLEPQLGQINTDLSSFRSSMSLLAADVSTQANPPRFSCAVTTDEIRVSGVIIYNICNVNTHDIMDRETGHVSIKESGDYFLSFTANMVSVNSQAVWCALYKQSAGNDGWQVLGMINNYQKNAENMDDRDTGSMTLITSLKAGDQIWVEWRGYGESFLYSNPYRLIGFTGFLLRKS